MILGKSDKKRKSPFAEKQRINFVTFYKDSNVSLGTHPSAMLRTSRNSSVGLPDTASERMSKGKRSPFMPEPKDP